MVRTFYLGYRRKGQKTWHKLTVPLTVIPLKKVRDMYNNNMPAELLPKYGLPKDAIFIAKEIRPKQKNYCILARRKDNHCFVGIK
jgi:hypothetical protein